MLVNVDHGSVRRKTSLKQLALLVSRYTPLSSHAPAPAPAPALSLSAIPYPLEDFCRHALFKIFPQEYFNNGCLHLSDWLV